MSIVRAGSIDHVNMSVRDLDKSVAFYSKIFGFTVKKDQPDMRSKIIGNDRIKLCLYEDPEIHVEAGLNHFGFHVDNFDEVIRICIDHGVPVLYGGAVDWEEKTKSVYVTDPTGYTIELSNTPGGGL